MKQGLEWNGGKDPKRGRKTHILLSSAGAGLLFVLVAVVFSPLIGYAATQILRIPESALWAWNPLKSIAGWGTLALIFLAGFVWKVRRSLR